MPFPQYGSFSSALNQLGLGSLLTTDSAGNPTGWLAQMIQQGVQPDQIGPMVEQTSVFQQRFPSIVQLRQMAAQGQAVNIPSPADVINVEGRIGSTMRYYGLDPGMYSPQDIQNLIVRFKGDATMVDKTATAAGNAYAQVIAAPQAVRDVFAQWYGPSGDQMLAHWFFDPDHMTANIDRYTQAAMVGGKARLAGLNMSQGLAQQVAGDNVSSYLINKGIDTAALMRSLAHPEVGDSTRVSDDQLLADALDQGSQLEVRQAMMARVNAMAGGGEATQSSRGVGGLLTAE